jgi:methylthioribose-1-phosphate isomerase
MSVIKASRGRLKGAEPRPRPRIRGEPRFHESVFPLHCIPNRRRFALTRERSYVLIDGTHRRSIWREADGRSVGIIDQTRLPHKVVTLRLMTLADAAHAISAMQTRGAPLIGAVAAYGMCLALQDDASDESLERAYRCLVATRPTAVNLKWALDEIMAAVRNQPRGERVAAAYARAAEICEEDIAINLGIGRHGLAVIEEIASRKPRGAPVNVLTHCNAGWLAAVDWGPATAPIYLAHEKGVPLHVWVDETRPRNQGAALTAFELGQQGVPHAVIADNTGGHLMQHGLVDLVITGTDRVTAQGDVCNKIGTYLKALAAHDTGVPFYVATPSPTIDFALVDGRDIPIEQRAGDEVATITGRTADGRIETVTVVPDGSPVANYAFDVTPARLVRGLITERGVLPATREALAAAFPERVGGR